ncbi:hypothetical protein Zmor_000779 [Zophobas morio]|uniref:Kv channel-interacting protein 1 n=1 Tax=Zophobas morio TaxID=2755281 RepID=A0AA38J5D4_9CUCU|nr:hypothetical protein Zmor_000779 [Zophobas morio]
MYPMVQQQQQQQQQQQPQQPGQQRRASHNEPQEDTTAIRHHRSRRPLYRRLFNYVREAWTGVKFALDSELEDLETPPRYRPDSLEALCKATRFTQAEIKRIYRGFKAECPTGVVKEETFKMIYSQFFPQGGELHCTLFQFSSLLRTLLINFLHRRHGRCTSKALILSKLSRCKTICG